MAARAGRGTRGRKWPVGLLVFLGLVNLGVVVLVVAPAVEYGCASPTERAVRRWLAQQDTGEVFVRIEDQFQTRTADGVETEALVRLRTHNAFGTPVLIWKDFLITAGTARPYPYNIEGRWIYTADKGVAERAGLILTPERGR